MRFQYWRCALVKKAQYKVDLEFNSAKQKQYAETQIKHSIIQPTLVGSQLTGVLFGPLQLPRIDVRGSLGQVHDVS